jgi:MoaA/NifB/PqqE/SkfB family radical SAM enzyme
MYSYKKYCEKLVDAGVTNFVISLHSHLEKIHDKIMGVGGTFKQATDGIRNLNELGKKVNINIVLTKLNYEHLEDHVKFLVSNFKIDEIRFTFVMLEGNTNDDPEGIVPLMSEVGPHICRGIDVAKGKASSFIYNMVPCLVPGHENYINDMGQLDTLLIGPDFEASLDEERKGKKEKAKTCSKCKYDKVCYGIWKKYVKLYGIDELKPIKK